MTNQKSKASFVVYIDESGDEGFVFNGDGSGSSRWLVLSAAVIRKANDLRMVSCLKEVREVLGKPPKSYGETEPAYLPRLKKTLYRHKGELMGYGIKVWPGDFETIKEKAPEIENLRGL